MVLLRNLATGGSAEVAYPAGTAVLAGETHRILIALDAAEGDPVKVYIKHRPTGKLI